jgi:hypothetical protein
VRVVPFTCRLGFLRPFIPRLRYNKGPPPMTNPPNHGPISMTTSCIHTVLLTGAWHQCNLSNSGCQWSLGPFEWWIARNMANSKAGTALMFSPLGTKGCFCRRIEHDLAAHTLPGHSVRTWIWSPCACPCCRRPLNPGTLPPNPPPARLSRVPQARPCQSRVTVLRRDEHRACDLLETDDSLKPSLEASVLGGPGP